jgi:ribosomal protein S10
MKEMNAGGVAGFQLPIGARERKSEMDECMRLSGDLKEAHMMSFLNAGMRMDEFFVALDLGLMDTAANIVREEVARLAIRQKINEVVRKKAGGGGFVLYSPNKGKKKASHPVATFPTKLAAKRAQLARFPPKDPKKLGRLRKEIQRLMKDPKKRAEAERRAAKQRGTDTGYKAPKVKKPKKESFDRELLERAILAEAVVVGVKRNLTEGLFKEEAPNSQWDEYLSQISTNVLNNDKGYKRIQNRLQQATEGALGQAMKMVQKALGGQVKVKAKGGTQFKDGVAHIPFSLALAAAEVGPIYIYVENGVPRIEFSDEAKNALVKVEPEMAKSIRGALASAEDQLGKVSDVRNATGERDQYLQRIESQVDKMIAGLSPLQVSMLKKLLVKKYRSTVK